MKKDRIGIKKVIFTTMLSVVFLFGMIGTAAAALPTNGTAGPAGTPTNPGYVAPTGAAIGAGLHFDTPTNPKIHSNYSANTDACASCHTTHTAIGANLLKWADTSTACFACHDGTVALAYDVNNGKNSATPAVKTSGGLFGSGGTQGAPTAGSSNHNVWNSVTVASAPGGSEVANIGDKLTGGDVNGTWVGNLSCSSCHTPHGLGGNGRILSPDPNGFAIKNKVLHGGANGTLATTTATVFTAPVVNWLKGYPYTDNFTKIYANGTLQTSGFSINYLTGVVTFDIAPAVPVTADYVPAIKVDLTVNQKQAANEFVTYNSGMNQFCGACHTDYNTDTAALKLAGASIAGHTSSGTYRTAYRHGVGMTWADTVRGTTLVKTNATAVLPFEGIVGNTGKVICLTCHFAHGTSDAFIQAKLTDNGNAGIAVAQGTTYDTVRSSALKRVANMGMCESCHQK